MGLLIVLGVVAFFLGVAQLAYGRNVQAAILILGSSLVLSYSINGRISEHREQEQDCARTGGTFVTDAQGPDLCYAPGVLVDGSPIGE